jgi:hypothetical protein
MRRAILIVAALACFLFGTGVLVDTLRPSGSDPAVGAIIGAAAVAIGVVVVLVAVRGGRRN